MANPSYDATKEIVGIKGLIKSNGPARFATPITPSDTAAVAIGPGGTYAKRLWIGTPGTGTLTVIMASDQGNGGLGTPVLFSGVPVGIMDIQVRAVMATGTNASNIVGLAD
jgi:hypothetical protein